MMLYLLGGLFCVVLLGLGIECGLWLARRRQPPTPSPADLLAPVVTALQALQPKDVPALTPADWLPVVQQLAETFRNQPPQNPITPDPRPVDYADVAKTLAEAMHTATQARQAVDVADEPKNVIQFVSGSGRRTIGVTLIAARTRRPNMAFHAMDCPQLYSRFVADHQEPNGVWIYRRVSVDLPPGAHSHA